MVMLLRMGYCLGTRLMGYTIPARNHGKDKSCVFLKCKKILNLRVCVHVSIGFNEHFKWWNDMQL